MKHVHNSVERDSLLMAPQGPNARVSQSHEFS